MNNALRIKLVTAGIVVAGTILAFGDKLTAVPGVPGWLAQFWPFVYGGAILFRELAHIFWPDVPLPPAPDASQIGTPAVPGEPLKHILPVERPSPLSGVGLTSNNPKP